ncbi:MAG: dihydroorotate dehydrogenase electron transfer subunit [Nitrospinota bacterium]
MNARILKQKFIAKDVFLTTLQVESKFRRPEAGSFVMIKVNNLSDPYLRRPFSIASYSEDNSTIEILVKIVGKTSELLGNCEVGAEIDVVGPFGKRFFEKPTFNFQSLWLVAGGTGVAPFLTFVEQNLDIIPKMELFIGAKDQKSLFLYERFKSLGIKVSAATEDASSHYEGMVTDLIANRLLDKSNIPELIYGCGPLPMMKALSKLSDNYNIPLYLSLENMMGCGFGVCLGCVQKAQGEESYHTVCVDGPVFNIERILI